MNTLTVNTISVQVLMAGMADYLDGTDGATLQAVQAFQSDVVASATVLALWIDMYKLDYDAFNVMVSVMYGNLSGVDKQTLADSYRDRIRSRLKAVADACNQPYKVPKKDVNGYNGYSLQLAGARKANKKGVTWTKGMQTTASNIKKASPVRKAELLATMLIQAGLTSATIDGVKDAMKVIEKAGNK